MAWEQIKPEKAGRLKGRYSRNAFRRSSNGRLEGFWLQFLGLAVAFDPGGDTSAWSCEPNEPKLDEVPATVPPEEEVLMVEFPANPTRLDPYKNFNFRLKWDGKYVAGV